MKKRRSFAIFALVLIVVAGMAFQAGSISQKQKGEEERLLHNVNWYLIGISSSALVTTMSDEKNLEISEKLASSATELLMSDSSLDEELEFLEQICELLEQDISEDLNPM